MEEEGNQDLESEMDDPILERKKIFGEESSNSDDELSDDSICNYRDEDDDEFIIVL